MNLFNYIKNHVSILDVVQHYATLKKAGSYYKGICPFHHEKTGSFTVSPHKEIFYCFGCHIGGDVITFISKAEQCSQLEAAQHLAEQYTIEIPESISKNSVKKSEEQHSEKKRYHHLCQLTMAWLHQNLIKSPVLLRYLTQRNISREIIEQFSIGYFPGGLNAIKQLLHYVQQEGFLVDDLCKAHIIAEGKSVLYSPFEERIIFTINDHLGRPCGFGGRIYKKNDERPKYYNSRENSYFSKGSLLFGLDMAKKAIQEKTSVFLVEGYTDCLAMVQHNHPNTVATLGTACTLEHLSLLARYTQELFILYDGDQAGKKAVLRLTELCWHVDVELKIIELPQGDDPASFLSAGKKLDELIAQAKDIFLFFLEESSQGFFKKGLQEKVTIVRNLLSTISSLDDALKQEILLARAAKTFDIPFLSLKKELKRISENHKTLSKNHRDNPSVNQGLSEELPANTAWKEMAILEKKLFSVIINNIKLLEPDHEEYLLAYLSIPLQDLLKKMLHIKGEDAHVDFVKFFDSVNENEKPLISHLVLECQEYEGPENFEYLFEQFQKKTWKSFVADTKIKLERAKQERDQETTQKILTQFLTLKKKLLGKGLI
jgi:DNA primase